MKVVILAGGYGTRLSEYTDTIPKPMVQISGKPILEHIMNIYSKYLFKDFFIALGYKSAIIKEYFLNYKNSNSDFQINLKTGKINPYRDYSKDWSVNLINTGQNSMTGGRILRLKEYLTETFFLTYGDAVCDIDINELLKFHKLHKKLVTITAVRPPARFGAIKIKGNYVSYFKEKSKMDEGWINGGFFVMEPKFLKLIKNDKTFLEREPLEKASKRSQLIAYKHEGFWQCLDTKRDKDKLEKILKKKKYKL
mgnify:CR=1 FL=1